MPLKEKVYEYFQTLKKSSFYIRDFNETVYFTPITVLEMQKLLVLSGAGQDTKEFHIFSLIEKLEDVEGKKIFGVEDKPFLEKLPWRVVTEITQAVHGADRPAEVKKTSETTPSPETSSPSATGSDAS